LLTARDIITQTVSVPQRDMRFRGGQNTKCYLTVVCRKYDKI